MPNLHHPQTDFTGPVTIGGHTVAFTDGVGGNDVGIAAFARAGYKVTPTIETGGETVDLDALTVADLRDIAKTEDVDLTGLTVKADIVTAIAHSGDDN